MAPSNDNKDKKSLKDLAMQNKTMLGDPVSLKAETSDTQPTDDDMPNKSSRARPIGNEGEKEGEKDNKSQLGDPVSLKAEPSQTEPTDEDRGTLKTETQSGRSKL